MPTKKAMRVWVVEEQYVTRRGKRWAANSDFTAQTREMGRELLREAREVYETHFDAETRFRLRSYTRDGGR